MINTDTKHLLGQLLLGKKIHCFCNCLIHIDVIGVVEDYSIENNMETIIHLKIEGRDKLFKIGSFHPGMKIDIYE